MGNVNYALDKQTKKALAKKIVTPAVWMGVLFTLAYAFFIVFYVVLMTTGDFDYSKVFLGIAIVFLALPACCIGPLVKGISNMVKAKKDIKAAAKLNDGTQNRANNYRF